MARRAQPVTAVEIDFGEGGRVRDREVLDAWKERGDMDAADLVTLDLPPMRMIVPDVLAAGTTVLAAPPKIGKSWLCVQIAVEVALGGELLGRRCEQGSALYLPLEDGKTRTQSRLIKVLGRRRLPKGPLTVRWDAPALGDGLEELIEAWLDGRGGGASGRPTVVIVDTLGKVRNPGDGRKNAYQVDVQDVGRLQACVKDRPNVALVLVHHTAKKATDDFVAAVSGTYGIAGSADTILTLTRVRQQPYGYLDVSSREINETRLAVKFDAGMWTGVSDAEIAVSRLTYSRTQIVEILMEHGPLWAKGVALLLGESNESKRIAIQQQIKALVEEGVLVKSREGYALTEAARTAGLSNITSLTVLTGGRTRVH